RTADERRIGAKPAAPQSFADHHHGTAAGQEPIVITEGPTSEWRDTEDLEVVAGDDFPPDLLRGASLGQLELPDAVTREAAEDAVLRLEVEEARIRARLV